LRRKSDVAQLAAIQAQLLRGPWCDPGRLLYCTCSVFRAEGDQIQAFLAQH
jgi:16S rRNA (cytosine967-C5)-methyltransferase